MWPHSGEEPRPNAWGGTLVLNWSPCRGTPSQVPLLFRQSESIPDALCYRDSDCPPGEPVVAGNGEAWNGGVGSKAGGLEPGGL